MSNRERARDRRAFAAAAIALFVLFLGNNMPSALYGLFRAAFGFSALTQTLLYSVAVAVILVGLLIFGPLSDVTGRRVLVAAGLVVFGVGDTLFAVAHGTGWLYAARVAQGLGMGLATAAASATLGDTSGGYSADEVRAQHIAGLTGTVCITGGLAVGPLLAGGLAQYAPAPRQLSFYVHLGMVVVALAMAWALPGRPAPSPPPSRPRPRLASFTVPAGLKDVFGRETVDSASGPASLV
jgi:MFS family permease